MCAGILWYIIFINLLYRHAATGYGQLMDTAYEGTLHYCTGVYIIYHDGGSHASDILHVLMGVSVAYVMLPSMSY